MAWTIEIKFLKTPTRRRLPEEGGIPGSRGSLEPYPVAVTLEAKANA